ncbi:hypothetical protein JCM1840_000475 [Sporobolomyces johnsonii]
MDGAIGPSRDRDAILAAPQPAPAPPASVVSPSSFPLFHLRPIDFRLDSATISSLSTAQLAISWIVPHPDYNGAKHGEPLRTEWRARKARAGARQDGDLQEPEFALLDLEWDIPSDLEKLQSAQLAALAVHPNFTSALIGPARAIFQSRRQRDQAADVPAPEPDISATYPARGPPARPTPLPLPIAPTPDPQRPRHYTSLPSFRPRQTSPATPVLPRTGFPSDWSTALFIGRSSGAEDSALAVASRQRGSRFGRVTGPAVDSPWMDGLKAAAAMSKAAAETSIARAGGSRVPSDRAKGKQRESSASTHGLQDVIVDSARLQQQGTEQRTVEVLPLPYPTPTSAAGEAKEERSSRRTACRDSADLDHRAAPRIPDFHRPDHLPRISPVPDIQHVDPSPALRPVSTLPPLPPHYNPSEVIPQGLTQAWGVVHLANIQSHLDSDAVWQMVTPPHLPEPIALKVLDRRPGLFNPIFIAYETPELARQGAMGLNGAKYGVDQIAIKADQAKKAADTAKWNWGMTREAFRRRADERTRGSAFSHENKAPLVPPQLLSPLRSLFLDNLPIDITRSALLAYLPPNSVVGIAINHPLAYRDTQHSQPRGSAFLLFGDSNMERMVVQQYFAGQRFPGAAYNLLYKKSQPRHEPWRWDEMEESWMQQHGGRAPPVRSEATRAAHDAITSRPTFSHSPSPGPSRGPSPFHAPPPPPPPPPPPLTSSSTTNAGIRPPIHPEVISALLHQLQSSTAQPSAQQLPPPHEDEQGTKRPRSEESAPRQGEVVVDPRKRAKH